MVVRRLQSLTLCLNEDDLHPRIIGFEGQVFVFPNHATMRKQPEDTERTYNMKQVLLKGKVWEAYKIYS